MREPTGWSQQAPMPQPMPPPQQLAQMQQGMYGQEPYHDY
jgi:hypothetical protein